MDGTGSIEREPSSATEKVAKLRLYLSPMELSELEAEGVVVVEEDNHKVREGPRFDEIWNVFLNNIYYCSKTETGQFGDPI